MTLANLCDDAAFHSVETQLHLADVVGDRGWDVDLANGCFTFSGGSGAYAEDLDRSRVHLLGSAAPGPRSWLWSWASEQGWARDVTDLAIWLRDFGHRQGVRELAESEIAFDDLPVGSPLEVGAVLLDAAKAASARWAGYTGDIGGGTRAVFLLEHPSFVLPAPDAQRVVRVLSEGLIGAPLLTDHRRAVAAYAAARPLATQAVPGRPGGDGVQLSWPGATVTVNFDEQDRVAGVKAALACNGLGRARSGPVRLRTW